jgi:hypothetical protein
MTIDLANCCPSPGIVSMVSGEVKAKVFVAAKLFDMAFFEVVERSCSRGSAGA